MKKPLCILFVLFCASLIAGEAGLFSTATRQCNPLYGPSNTRASDGSSSTFFTRNNHHCRLCTIDCASYWIFSSKYSTSWTADGAKIPTRDEIVQSTTCQCKYYNYGCQANTHCLLEKSHDEFLTAIGFCIIHNGCKIHSSISDTNFKSTVADIASVQDTENTYGAIMRTESKVLKNLGVRTSLIYQFSRVQDIKDAVLNGKSYDTWIASPNGKWRLEDLPSFVNSSLKAFPISRAFYERVGQKVKQDALPEDSILKDIREYAEKQLSLEKKLRRSYSELKRANLDFIEKIKAAYNYGKAHFDLMENEIDSLRLGLFLTRETEEEEREQRKQIIEEAKRRAEDNEKLAEISVFNLFLGDSWKDRERAIKALINILKAEWNAKAQVYINRLTGKVSSAALEAAASVKDGAEKAANEIAKQFPELGDKIKNVAKEAGKEIKNTAKKAEKEIKRIFRF